ncbi:MAG: zinc-ribbon domain-containing protein [Lachnospiraceae bacterium]
MFCTKCGKELKDDMLFCTQCGAKIVYMDARAEQPLQAEPAYIQTETADVKAEQPQVQMKPQSGNGKKWGILGGAAAGVIAIIVLVIVILGGKGKNTEDQDVDLAGKETIGEDGTQAGTAEGEPVAKLSLCFREVIYNEGLSDVRVFLTSGYDNPDGEVISELTTQADGTAQTNVAAGEYTLCWEAGGYYSGHENLTVSGTEMNIVEHMLPVLTDRKSYVLIEWDSDRDLDLCVYNAQTDQYINITSAVDDTGSFLYCDNSGEEGYELIYLGDYTAGIYTVYVRDGASLSQGTNSTMESDGLTVSIYTADGLLYHEKADASETAALWSPVYLYQGEAFELEDYIYDLTDYAWATRDKKDDSYARNEEALEVYTAFLRGEYATADGRYLTDLLPEFVPVDMWNGYVDEITYAYLDLGADNVQELLVTFVGMDIYESGDDSTWEYVLRYDGTTLSVCYEFETWARSYTGVSYYGVVNGDGSNGAASHMYAQTVLDAEGNAVAIYECDEEGEITSYMEPFYSDGVDFRDLGVSVPDMGLCSYKVADSYYLVYEDDMNEGRAGYEEASAFCANFGYQLYTHTQIEEIIAEHIRQQGIEDWLIQDTTQLVKQTLDTQYYADYVEPETLTLTADDIEELTDIAYATYKSLGRYIFEYGGDYGEVEGDYDVWEIGQKVKENMSGFLWRVYHGHSEYLGESSIDGVGYYTLYQVDAEEVRCMLKELFGMEYDLTTLTRGELRGDDSDSGAYYENGKIITYMTPIGSISGPYYGGMYEEDGAWKFYVEEVWDGEVVTGYIELWLRPVNNSYGYEITGCCYESYL